MPSDEVVHLLLEHGSPFEKDDFSVAHEQIDAVTSGNLGLPSQR